MSGNKGLLDSNIIIDASKGIISIQEITEDYDFLYASLISYVETLGYNFADNEEVKIVEQILNSIEIVDLTKEIADIAIEYRKMKKIKLPDALVLATSKYLKADLITSDIMDFQNVDNSVKIVQPRKLKGLL
jgi:predicted nucleic acid-binding protein